MCTLSIFRTNTSIVFTSNRDDRTKRSFDEIVTVEKEGLKVFYPKDKLKNGTWLAFSNQGEVAILLNGCEQKHTKAAHHILSRGKIPIECLMNNGGLSDFATTYNFMPFEPFTLVVFKNNAFQELLWNGKEAVIGEFHLQNCHRLWSSVTLYDAAAIKERQCVFNHHFNDITLNAKSVFELLTTPSDDLYNGFFMVRDNVRTLSTSQIELRKTGLTFKILNHISQKEQMLTIKTKNETLVC